MYGILNEFVIRNKIIIGVAATVVVALLENIFL